MANNKHSQGISRLHLMQLTGAGVLATGLGAKLIAPNEASASEVAEKYPCVLVLGRRW
jgi:hypothetical protein